MATGIGKSRVWCGVGYPENMPEDWREGIGDSLQVPYAYCVHDQDVDSKGDHRKTHVHVMIVFPSPTTSKHALNVLNQLSELGKTAFSTVEPAINTRHAYDYLIHDTEDCRKKKKHLYTPSERVSGNNFDIGDYEQLSATKKQSITKELCFIIREKKFTNFMDFYAFVIDNCDDEHFEVMDVKSSFLERLIKGNYHKYVESEK